jgi:hypothetical protein
MAVWAARAAESHRWPAREGNQDRWEIPEGEARTLSPPDFDGQ